MYWRIPGSALGAAIAVMVMASMAFAHAAYERSNPSKGQVLTMPPAVVEIFTSQDLRRAAGTYEITVADERGARVDNGDTRIDDSNRRRFQVTLKPDLPPGRYVVRFKTLSDEDGEEDEGAFAFYVGTQPTDAQRAQDGQLRLTKDEVPQTPLVQEGPQAGISTIVAGAIAAAAIAILGVAAWLLLLRRPARPGGP
jgi:methionine-rich copper-binding protein CopC